MIKLILFDWGDVCGLYNIEVFNIFLDKIGHDSKIVGGHFKEWKGKFDRDEISEEEFWTKLAGKLRFKKHWSILASNNNKNLIVNWPVLDFIKEVKEKTHVALLSNMDKTSIDAIKKEINLEDYFEKIYFSSEHKTGKLEKKVIDKVLGDFGVSTEEVLFIDDFPGNLDKAKEYGMKTILFTGVDDLKDKVNEFLI